MVPIRFSKRGGLLNPRVLLCFLSSYDMYWVCCNSINEDDVIDNVKADVTSDRRSNTPKTETYLKFINAIIKWY